MNPSNEPTQPGRSDQGVKPSWLPLYIGLPVLIVVALVGLFLLSDDRKKDEAEPDGEVVTTESGLKYQDWTGKGDGAEAKPGDRVSVHYTGWLDNGGKKGQQFDSSRKPGRGPYELTIGKTSVIQGWHEGLVGMKVGGKRRLMIPAKLAYGEEGRPPTIPPNADLIFDIELLEIRE
jgi:peptidylprolyl isomerase